MPDCIFCKIVRGEVPSHKVYEDGNTLAFLDIHPVNPGHVLIVPKAHAANIFDISAEEWSHVQETVRKAAVALERATGADGVNLMMNNREHAGQVVDHTHVHLIPRFKNDGLKLWPHKEYKEGEAEAMAEKVRAALA
ncbi:MAG TPA: HIT family protein [Candidatus Paceibacterota bacterium]|jgi:histidine triad (HIT) family protein|nr:HIT family protein [Candidatus Paceibacterota bacterium]